jgi:hypothetical protein
MAVPSLEIATLFRGISLRKEAYMADWVPPREQDLVDLCQKWKSGWNQTEVTATLGAADAFLTARAK